MKIDEITLPSVVQSVNSYSDLCRHYSIPDNGKGRRFLRELVIKYGLSTNHWDWHKKLYKYPIVNKDCPICKTTFTTQIGSKGEKTTCSHKCSNIYFSNKRHTLESDRKISESVKKYHLSIGRQVILHEIKCAVCGKEKITKKKTQRCCSNKCARILTSQNPLYRQKLRDVQMKLIAEGRHSGWTSRNILSYPEKFFITVLNNNGIKFIANKPFLSYFLDFAIEDKMVDLEIDGKQHKYPERKTSDAARDEVLTKNGWRVYRIEWNSINTEEGKKVMKEKIDKFLEFYRTT